MSIYESCSALMYMTVFGAELQIHEEVKVFGAGDFFI